MKTIAFINPGEIDVRSIKSFGVSVKETKNPIGYFGTGLKYAIAIFLRTGHQVTIASGESRFIFGLKDVEMRGKPFQFITMNDEEMPFTTELGKNWEIWQAFREVYCNCIDEGGEGRLVVDDEFPEALPGQTVVMVTGSEVERLWSDRGVIVLDMPKSLEVATMAKTQVFRKPSRFIYYRGIRVLTLEKPTLFTYNFEEDLVLTEDRTLKDPSIVESRIAFALAGMTDKSAIRSALTTGDRHREGETGFGILDYYQECVTPEFHEVLEDEFKRNNDQLNKWAKSYFQGVMKKNASKHYDPATLTKVQEKQLKRCTEIALRIYPDFTDYEVMVVKHLGQSTMALADKDRRTMVVSLAAFELGTKYLLSTLIEEYTHLKTGYNDQTRQMQTHLFDTICTLIENHVIQEPV